MTTVAFAENVAGGNIECRKQDGNAVSLVVVRASLQLSSPHGQHRLGTAQSLDLRLLIHAQHQGTGGQDLSFRPQGLHRIDGSSSSRWNDASEKGASRQRDDRSSEDQGVPSFDLVQLGGDQAGAANGHRNTND